MQSKDARNARLTSLAARHRLEEVAERFGVMLTARDAATLTLPFGELADLRPDGWPATPDRLRGRAADLGLCVEDDAVVFAYTAENDPAELEELLLAFLGGLYEADPGAFLRRPPRGVRIPSDADLPESTAWLERFYGDGAVAREKKPIVVDLARSRGPYLRSIDRDPIQIVDAASQIASLPAGFAPDAVQCALDDGRMDAHLVCAGDTRTERGAVRDFARAVRASAPPGLRYVSLTNGGAEANEKAFDIARSNCPNPTGAHRIVAFEGSFHGRTLLSLYSTWNPVKRQPYQLPGFETQFVPFPLCPDPYADPVIPPGWREGWSERAGDRDALAAAAADDPVLAAEVASLRAAEALFASGEVLACIIEPYQCEGGDRLATRRFFHGLRALTRAWGVPLVFDEVQAGFGLSGAFFWTRNFFLIDAEGRADGPDLITGAKRAQTGYVLSRWPDQRPTHAHSASVVRGQVHAKLVSPALHLAAYTREKLEALAGRAPAGLVTRPRVYGDAFAFDAPTREIAMALIAQRFYRGYMCYIAGQRTLRYRLNRAYRKPDVDAVFQAIEDSLAALVEWAGGIEGDRPLFERMSEVEVPEWAPRPRLQNDDRPRVDLAALLAEPTAHHADAILRTERALPAELRPAVCEALGLPDDARGPTPAVMDALRGADPVSFEATVGVPLLRAAADLLGTRLRRIPAHHFPELTSSVDFLQQEAYEPARRESMAEMATISEAEDGVCLVAEDPEGVVGVAFGGPLELWWGLDGPRQDAHFGRRDTFYSADITVAARARGRGVGIRLRLRQIQEVLAARRPDARPRYAFITGRNRIGSADAMWALNEKLGAYVVAEYHGQYGEPAGRARYYRVPLRRHDRRAFAALATPPDRRAMGLGVLQPTGPSHPLLRRARDLGVFDDGAITKLTLSNFITRPYVRYAEYIRAIAPAGLPHMYFTSSLDEMVDKSLRVLKHKRTASRIAVGLRGGYFGHTSAAARTLTDWGASQPMDGFFGWPHVPHPAEDPERTIAALDALVAEAGAETLLGVYVEPVQWRTGATLSEDAWAALLAWRARTGVPIVLSETTTGRYRSGHGAWWSDGVHGHADLVLWWGGGQLGHIFCTPETFVEKPLSFISTWDGDELSATRSLWQFYACMDAPVAERSAELEAGLVAAGIERMDGLGLYRVLRFGANPVLRRVERTMERYGITLERVSSRALAVAPPITASGEIIERLCGALRVAVDELAGQGVAQ